MHKKTIIFDFDGTIADTLPVVVDILNAFARAHGFREITPDEHHDLRDKPARELIRHLGVSLFKVPSLLRHGRKELRKHIDEVKPFAGMPEVLRELHHSYRLGILTTNSRANVNRFLEQTHLDNLFEFVRSEKKLFGKDKALRRIMRREHITVDSVVYVGDELRDIVAAQKTEIPVISVTWGLNSPELLEKHNHGMCAAHPKDLKISIETIFKD